MAGLQVPVSPFVEVDGKTGGSEYSFNGPIGAKFGVTCGDVVIVSVKTVAFCPASGVNVYMVVPTLAVLIVAGLHVPVIAGIFVELVGNTGGMLFWQSGPIALKVGVIVSGTSITMVMLVAHCPASGVNV